MWRAAPAGYSGGGPGGAAPGAGVVVRAVRPPPLHPRRQPVERGLQLGDPLAERGHVLGRRQVGGVQRLLQAPADGAAGVERAVEEAAQPGGEPIAGQEPPHHLAHLLLAGRQRPAHGRVPEDVVELHGQVDLSPSPR